MTATEAFFIGLQGIGLAALIISPFVLLFVAGWLRQSSMLREKDDDEFSANEVALSYELNAFVRSINEQGQKAA